jgi:3-phenylpropionate/trans-cinnamate dioxygenase ferredoxin component
MSWHRAAPLAELRAAHPWLPLTVAGIDIIAGNVDGAWYAVDDRCAHAGCPFSTEGALVGSRLICRCHGSEYALPTGEVRRGPAEKPIRSYPVRVADNDLEVDL